MIKYLLALLLLAPAVMAATEHTGDQNVDARSELCNIAYSQPYESINRICGGVRLSTDSSNKFNSADIQEGVARSNSVGDTELALLEEEYEMTATRVYKQWNNIVSVMVLLLEAVKILFYAAQLFIIVHLPYFYVKVLIWVKKLAVGAVGKRQGR